jgi:hypothetical protein
VQKKILIYSTECFQGVIGVVGVYIGPGLFIRGKLDKEECVAAEGLGFFK